MARARLVVAFDACSVSAALVSRGLRGPSVGPRTRASLSPGALVPSAFDPNIARPEEVRGALTRVRQALGGSLPGATLVLPDGVARLVLLETAAGADPRDYARFRLGPTLSYPAGEAVVDALALGGGRVLAAAVRRSVVEGYEAAAAAAGLTQEAVDLMPLAALAGLLRRSEGPGSTVNLILGDVAVSFAAFQGGALRVLRTRRRDPGPGEVAWLAKEAERTATLAGDGAPALVRVVGRGARELRDALADRGLNSELGEVVEVTGAGDETAELAWLGAALA